MSSPSRAVSTRDASSVSLTTKRSPASLRRRICSLASTPRADRIGLLVTGQSACGKTRLANYLVANAAPSKPVLAFSLSGIRSPARLFRRILLALGAEPALRQTWRAAAAGACRARGVALIVADDANGLLVSPYRRACILEALDGLLAELGLPIVVLGTNHAHALLRDHSAFYAGLEQVSV